MLLLFWTFFTASVYGQGTIESINNELKISVLTCGPGTELYSMYGHNAIRIIDPDKGSDIVYNYGTFSFDEPGFMVKFLRGKLMYYVTVAPYNHFIYEYQMTNRFVNEQVLSLNYKEKIEIAEALKINLLPENRNYKYDFFQDNCATRIRDMILKKNIAQLSPVSMTPLTFRQLIKKYQAPMPWTDFGIDLIIGAKADVIMTPNQECFIPDYLSYHLSNTKLSNTKQPIVSTDKVLFTSTPPKSRSNPWLVSLVSPYFIFILLLLLEINLYFRAKIGKAMLWFKTYDRLWVLMLSIMAVILSFMWWGTDHVPTKTNWNLIWVIPFLVFWWFVRSKSGKNNWILGFGNLLFLVVSLLNAVPGLNFLPQYFHPIVGIISLILIIKMLRVKPLPWKNDT